MTNDFEFDAETWCIYKILQKENNITSKRILELSTSDEFSKICTGCASGDALLRAMKKLEKADIVHASLGKGGYRWMLKDSDDYFEEDVE